MLLTTDDLISDRYFCKKVEHSNHREKTINLNLFEWSSSLNSLRALQCQWIHHYKEGDAPHGMLVVEGAPQGPDAAKVGPAPAERCP